MSQKTSFTATGPIERDFEGHVWTFSQTIRHVCREEAEALTGCQIDGWHRVR